MDNQLIKVSNHLGMEVSFSPVGAAIFDILIPTIKGLIPVTVHPQDIGEFNQSLGHFGKTIGRIAGRIRFGQFSLNNHEYQIGPREMHGLHGGNASLAFKEFQVSQHENQFASIIMFTYMSPDGESGFPGNMRIQVTYQIPHLLNQIDIIYHAFSDRDTVMNLSNHTYWNLNGSGDILSHYLRINADQYAEIDEYACPQSIENITPSMDFRQPHRIGDYINHESLISTGGYNHPYICDDRQELRPIASLFGNQSHIQLTLYSDYPTLVFYSGNVASREVTNYQLPYLKHQALALECQFLPNAMNQAFGQKKTGFLPANTNYRQQITLAFSVLD